MWSQTELQMKLHSLTRTHCPAYYTHCALNAPHSLCSAQLLTRTHRTLVKSRALYREQGAIWDATIERYSFPPVDPILCSSPMLFIFVQPQIQFITTNRLTTPLVLCARCKTHFEIYIIQLLHPHCSRAPTRVCVAKG